MFAGSESAWNNDASSTYLSYPKMRQNGRSNDRTAVVGVDDGYLCGPGRQLDGRVLINTPSCAPASASRVPPTGHVCRPVSSYDGRLPDMATATIQYGVRPEIVIDAAPPPPMTSNFDGDLSYGGHHQRPAVRLQRAVSHPARPAATTEEDDRGRRLPVVPPPPPSGGSRQLPTNISTDQLIPPSSHHRRHTGAASGNQSSSSSSSSRLSYGVNGCGGPSSYSGRPFVTQNYNESGT